LLQFFEGERNRMLDRAIDDEPVGSWIDRGGRPFDGVDAEVAGECPETVAEIAESSPDRTEAEQATPADLDWCVLPLTTHVGIRISGSAGIVVRFEL
jgi:hypothetical protein